LFETATQDLTALQFPVDMETVVSAGSYVDLEVEGVKSNGVDMVMLSDDVEWSLSPGAASSINRHGRFSAGAVAETVTVHASLGILSAEIDLRVSTAEFDRVVALNDEDFDIDMCRSHVLNPVGRYVDEDGNEEIRSVDSTVMETIVWEVFNAEDSSTSQRAYIMISNNQPRLQTLEAGELLIRARAYSIYQEVEVTSDDFGQNVSSNLESVKLCSGSADDLEGCFVTTTSVEQDDTISLIAVGAYPSSSGTSYENITRNAKWGASYAAAASRLLSSDYMKMEITGDIEETNTTLSVACGTIAQSISGIDVSEGVILEEPVSCGSNVDCVSASATLEIDLLSVDSLEVTLNDDIELTHNITEYLDSSPDQLVLEVTANYANDTSADITNDSELVYWIVSVDGQDDIIEEVDDEPGTYTVLGTGIAKIQVYYRGETFIVLINIP
jgi:hypothetical protein